jgi:hypothetical protein
MSTNSKQILVSVVHENRSAQCPQTTSKYRCPVATNYKQISVSVVQEHRSTHKLQANYNLIIIIIIIKTKTKTHKMQTIEMNLKWS